jgi:DnaD/phage-associated family protein
MNTAVGKFYSQGYITADGIDEFVSAGIKQDNKIKDIIDRTGSARNVSSKDREFYRTWTSVWGFDDEVILYAAELSVGKPYPMTYMNQLLSSWKNSGAMTVEKAKAMGVKVADNKGQTHKENYMERQYTNDEIQSIFGDIENFENLDI